ncbi:MULTISPECIES: leucyl aminopeptidase family protein [unclassified Roseitalea]|uniref:leucyl aminopeptidase family protein n=1 Tax=unclassified Roseitalea TaxID=2639107 RepID=UPI00273EF7F3|nr:MULTISPECIES: leucyl aminopeptidase family protein [unclassified Roseitalea]
MEAGATLPDRLAAWRGQCRFDGEAGSVLLVPDEAASRPGAAIVALGAAADPFALGALAGKLPAGDWYIANPEVTDIALATLGFCLGGYRFDRYRPAGRADVRLVVDDAVDADRLASSVDSIFLTRDLINTPANDMGPDAIEAAARALARHGKASIKVTTGEDLLGRNFPLVYMVGRASRTPPRLIDMRWGRRGAPRVTLVGKGVAFDTGGLNIKPASAMRNMKKDMGGAANVLGLARMIMDAGLDVRLRVLIPAVENAISGNAFRPGDVLPTRKGLTVEIGNTDAEGRLVLADALTLADEEKPELIVDMATLTGAARVALGPELPPFFTDDDDIADRLARAALKTRDPLWRMPLWRPYERNLSSTVADCANVTTDGFAGSVTAALFLSKFVAAAASWVHFDVFGWNPTSRPHAPVGGEAHGIRALFSVIEDRFGSG